ncbi:MAG: NfeD family protein [Mucispirillum sp.]|nr:NfeD family protein [Mucispirillum sp.]
MSLAVMWLILVIILIIVEISTTAYISLWFIFGAVAAMFLSFATDNVTILIAVFLFVSFLSLILFRPFALRYAKPKALSNIDALIGAEGIVIEPIDYIENTGRIKVLGQEWAAISEDKKNIEINKKVIILDITGIKLIVKEEE